MGTTRLTLSLEEIDLQILELKMKANEKEKEGRELEAEAKRLRTKAERLSELRQLAIEVGTPVPSGRSRINRQLQIANFLIQNGPQTRKAIIEKTGIPEGTVNSEMRDKEIFVEVGGNLWDATDAFKGKQNIQSSNDEDEDGSQSREEGDFTWRDVLPTDPAEEDSPSQAPRTAAK